MQKFMGYASADQALKGSVVVMGNFDGLHIGHQAIVSAAKVLAQNEHRLLAMYTFQPHPLQVLRPCGAPDLIVTEAQKQKKAEQLGIDRYIVEPFTEAYSLLSPEEFVQKVLVEALGVSWVVVGVDFRFGRAALGDVELLKTLGEKGNFQVKAIEAVKIQEGVCSSSRIRQLIKEGKVEEAGCLLGAPYCLTGKVVQGQQKGASELGIPSANLFPEQSLLPALGVYITDALLEDGRIIRGATNIGRRPTFGEHNELQIETHLLNFSGTIYGQYMELRLLKKVRDEMKFSSLEALRSQIKKDIDRAANYTLGR